jgi:hypothetical protein
LQPRLVQLAHPEPDVAWQAIAARRGAAFLDGAISRSREWDFTRSRGLTGLDGVLAYWRTHGALCDRLVSLLAMDTLVVDVSTGSWPERRHQLCTWLGIPPLAPPQC